jgi:hypothetical protein
LVDGLRASEPRFSRAENHVLTATMLHIQGGFSLIGLRSAGRYTAAPGSWQDLEQFVSNTSALYALLELKHQENPSVPEFSKLLATPRVLDEDVRRLAPLMPASQLLNAPATPIAHVKPLNPGSKLADVRFSLPIPHA